MDFKKVIYQMLLLLFTIQISTTFGNHEEDLFKLTPTSDSAGFLKNIREMLKSIELIEFKDISITMYQLENEIGLIVQMGRHNKKVKRSIEFEGTVFKWMYGIADADDVRRYDSTIDKLENNEKD
ncbi:low-density lipoprotein receptor-related protein 2 isoform X1, partial [Aphis craccivora]